MKKIFVLLAVLMFIIAACAPALAPVPPTVAPTTAPPATQQPAATQPPAATATTAPATAAPKAPPPTATPITPGVTAAPNAVKIQFWSALTGASQVATLQRLMDNFNKANPQYYLVQTVAGNYDQTLQKTNAAIQAGATPDMVIGNPGDLATYDTAGAVVDLTSYINGADGLSAAQQSEINKSLYFDTWNNKIIGVSWGRSAQVLFYNVEALNAAGFAKPPETWDDFDAVCAKVTTPTFSCYAFVSSTSTFASMVWSRGGNYASADEKKAVFDEQAGVDTLKWLKNAAEKKYAYSPSASFGDQTDFGNGKVLFTFGSTAGLPFYYTAVKGSAKPFKWDIAAMPRGPNGKNNVDIFGPSVGVLKSNADKQKGAWLFIKYLLTQDAELDWAANVNYFPATKSAIDATVALDDAKAKALAPAFPDYLPQFKSGLQFFATIGRREPTAPAWQAVRGIIANMNTAVFLQKTGPDFKAIDPAEAAKEGVQRVNDALASFGK